MRRSKLPDYSITSSARARILSGTATPSARIVTPLRYRHCRFVELKRRRRGKPCGLALPQSHEVEPRKASEGTLPLIVVSLLLMGACVRLRRRLGGKQGRDLDGVNRQRLFQSDVCAVVGVARREDNFTGGRALDRRRADCLPRQHLKKLWLPSFET